MPGRPYILAETTWREVSSTDYSVAVLPWGATEAHNYHLPYNTDVVQCDHIAAESARQAWDRGAKVIVLPTVPFGVNTGQVDIKLDINMNPSTQLAVLEDIVEGLGHQGIEKLVILNGHGANDFRQIVRELWPTSDVFLCTLDWYKWIDSSIFEDPGDHAGEMETSLMQVFAPGLVRPLSEAGDGAEKTFRIPALKDGRAWTQRDWVQATSDTGVGDPAPSSAEKGQRCFELLTPQIADFFVDLAEADLDDLYE
ncbi:MAG: creatininase family protein [Candidatus Latescibacteria bacterium]|nr:creatininase family protein [Candidatus Latescibacterota bacterium]MDP7634869.1 creatininase family protein [Candidatus Latescibacterota bacterium]